jgi:hypothetical protein
VSTHQAPTRRHGGAGQVDQEPRLAVVGARTGEQQVGGAALEHRARRDRHRAVGLELHLRVQGEGGGPAALRQVGDGRRHRRVVGEHAVPAEHRGDPRGGEHRPGRDDPAELLQHDHQLGDPVALAAELFRHRQTQPAEAGELVPEGRQAVLLAVDRRPDDRRRDASGGEASSRVEERLVVVPDGDAHVPRPPVPAVF